MALVCEGDGRDSEIALRHHTASQAGCRRSLGERTPLRYGDRFELQHVGLTQSRSEHRSEPEDGMCHPLNDSVRVSAVDRSVDVRRVPYPKNRSPELQGKCDL